MLNWRRLLLIISLVTISTQAANASVDQPKKQCFAGHSRSYPANRD